MNEKLKILSLGILAGLSISFGSAAYIACAIYANRILGSILFSIGLLIICAFGFKLYTGQIGKVFENKKEFILDLLIMLFGNFIGAMGAGLLASFTNVEGNYTDVVMAVGNSKLITAGGGSVTWYALLIQSLFCGMLVYFAVEIYKFGKDNVTKVLGLIMAVAAFVVSGHSHCIANMYYLGVSRLFITNFGWTLLSLLISIIGNSCGAILINLLMRFAFKKRQTSDSDFIQ